MAEWYRCVGGPRYGDAGDAPIEDILASDPEAAAKEYGRLCGLEGRAGHTEELEVIVLAPERKTYRMKLRRTWDVTDFLETEPKDPKR